MFACFKSCLGWRDATLQSHLLRLVLAAMVPLLIFSVGMVVLLAQRERATFQRGLVETTRALTHNVDRLLQASANNLESMASSPSLDGDDSDDFCSLAERMLRSHAEWRRIILLDSAGAQLCTSIGKHSAPAPGVVERDTLDAVVRSRRPVLSNLFADEHIGASVGMYAPVVRANKVVFIIVAVLPPSVFADILRQQKMSRDWAVMVVDRKKTIVARMPEDGRFVGKTAAPLMAGNDGRSGGERNENVVQNDAAGVYVASNDSASSGWSVVVAVPAAEVDRLFYRSLLTVGGAGIGFVLVGLCLASIFARRIAAPVRSLAALAGGLGRAQKLPSPRPAGLAEVDSLTQNLVRAADLLEKRASERAKVETELREKEEFLQRQADLLDLTGEAIIGWELGGPIIYWNRGAEKLYGIARRDAIGQPSHDILASLFPGIDLDIAPMLNDAREWSGELKHVTRDGRALTVERHVRFVQERSGRRLVLEGNRDISARKQFIQRITTEHAITVILSESNTLEEAMGKLLEVIGMGLGWEVGFFWKVRDNGSLIECMETWHASAHEAPGLEVALPLARGAGLPGRVWATMDPLWISDLHQDAGSLRVGNAAAANLRGAFAFPIKLHGEVLGVVEFLSREAREPDAELLTMVVTVGSEIGQFIERLRAETALRQSEENLRRQAQELERQLLASGRLVAVGELTASMTHEFNNPLGIILGFAQSVLAEMEPSDPHYHHLEIIVEEAQRCERIVQELLEFGRPRDSAFAATDVKSIIEKTLNLISSRAAKNQVAATINVADSLPSIYADAQQLQQVLLNLCLNSLDAMPQGGELILAAASSGAANLTIKVQDTGWGIESDALPRIFQPFFTAKKRRGLGLGLPICNRIVKAHGGRIDVESEPGQGTSFTIHLPIEPQTQSTP
jgi:PAS domain S-box-containing protein